VAIEPEPIVAVPFSPYGFESPGIAELAAFLWFSDRTCECWGHIERFVLSRAHDPALVASFFAYSHRKERPISAHQWADRLSGFSVDFYSILAISLYFAKLDRPALSDPQKSLARLTLAKLGVREVDGVGLVSAFLAESGVRKLLLSLLFRFHREGLPEWFFSPELEPHIGELLQCDSPEMVTAALSNALFSPSCARFLSAATFAEAPPPDLIELSPSFVDAVLESRNSLSVFFHFLLIATPLTDLQYTRFAASVVEGHSLYVHSSKLDPTHYSVYLRNKPPSYSRQFTRFASLTHLPRTRLPPQIRPICPALLPQDVLSEYPEFADAAFPDREVFDSTTFTLHAQVEKLLQLPDADVCSVFRSPSLDAALIEFLGAFLRRLPERPRFLADTIFVVKAILTRATLDMLVIVVMSEEFLNSEDFVLVFMIVKLYVRQLAIAGADLGVVALMLENKIASRQRLALIRQADVAAALRALLFRADAPPGEGTDRTGAGQEGTEGSV
jgi:hypothetical protein